MCFDADKCVEEPGSDREVGVHVWVQHAEVVKEDKVLDCQEWCRWCCSRDQMVFWVWWGEGCHPYSGKVSVRKKAHSGGK